MIQAETKFEQNLYQVIYIKNCSSNPIILNPQIQVETKFQNANWLSAISIFALKSKTFSRSSMQALHHIDPKNPTYPSL
jgi:hypothetical protein